MTNAFNAATDFTTHHIEGIAREGNTPFICPLITQVEGNLWQGGCINGVSLGGRFEHVISLYPWERFAPMRELQTFFEARLYDGPTVPDEEQLYAIARLVNFCRKKGPTLVHCQAGLNRSALITSLALILEGEAPAAAIALLRKQRSPAVLCNKAFESWLLTRALLTDGTGLTTATKQAVKKEEAR